MLRPSYSELIDVLNNEKNVDSEITSRYTIVLAVAKRARQIIEGTSCLINVSTDRAVSTAVKELAEGRLKIRLEKADTDIYAERQTQQYYKGFSSVSKDDLREDYKDKYEPRKRRDDEDEYDEEDLDEDDELAYKNEDYEAEEEDIDADYEDVDDDEDEGEGVAESVFDDDEEALDVTYLEDVDVPIDEEDLEYDGDFSEYDEEE